MSRQGDKYERTVAFCLNIFCENKPVEQIYLQETMVLPACKKVYKVTLKNVEVYVSELLEIRPEIVSIRLDRISHVKIYDRTTQFNNPLPE